MNCESTNPSMVRFNYESTGRLDAEIKRFLEKFRFRTRKQEKEDWKLTTQDRLALFRISSATKIAASALKARATLSEGLASTTISSPFLPKINLA